MIEDLTTELRALLSNKYYPGGGATWAEIKGNTATIAVALPEKLATPRDGRLYKGILVTIELEF